MGVEGGMSRPSEPSFLFLGDMPAVTQRHVASDAPIPPPARRHPGFSTAWLPRRPRVAQDRGELSVGDGRAPDVWGGGGRASLSLGGCPPGARRRARELAAVGSRKARAPHPLGTWGHNSGCPLSVVGRGALLLEAGLEPRACMTGLGPPRQSTTGPGTVCAACFPAASVRGLQTPSSPRVPTCSPPVVSVSSSPLLQRTPVTLSQGHPSALLLTQLPCQGPSLPVQSHSEVLGLR